MNLPEEKTSHHLRRPQVMWYPQRRSRFYLANKGERKFFKKWMIYVLVWDSIDFAWCPTVIFNVIPVILWLLVRSMYFVSLLFLAQSFWNTWNFLSEKSNKGVFYYVREVTFELHLWMRLVARETNLVFRGLELSVPPQPLKGERG